MSDLYRLATLAGISLEYTDVWGKVHHASDETLIAILKSLSLPAETEEERRESIISLEVRNARMLPEAKCLRMGCAQYVSVRLRPREKIIKVTVKENSSLRAPERGVAIHPQTLPVYEGGLPRFARNDEEWEAHNDGEGGARNDGDYNGEEVVCSVDGNSILIPALPMGYHTLKVTTDYHLTDTVNPTETLTHLIVYPEKCYLPPALEEENPVFGIAVQTYSLRSRTDWGIGDFTDLLSLASAAADHKADLIGVNPLHALFPENPNSFSPYSPSNRLYLNHLYIDVQKIDGFYVCEAVQEKLATPEWQALLTQTRNETLINYPKVASMKRWVLEQLFAFHCLRKTEEDEAYLRFCEEKGESLKHHATFMALSEAIDPASWPDAYYDKDSYEVKHFVEMNEGRIAFFMWVEWQAEKQLETVQETAKEKGMNIGLYRDLAVGPDPKGSEVWMERSAFASGVAVGAPPDIYNPSGQNWGLPPLHPIRLTKEAYAPFIRLLRANMSHTGALRIDHAFGLSRLFFIPTGKSSSEGTYVHYPFDDLLAVIRIESHRAGCVVIGEDLGTFPPGFAEKAEEAGLLSYRVFYFEHEGGAWKAPEDYPYRALACVSTHDLPTFTSWFEGADIALRQEMRLYPNDALRESDIEDRKRYREMVRAALNAKEGELSLAAHCYIARSHALIAMVQIEDILGVKEQANLPSTTTEHPNWRRKLPLSLEEIFTSDPRFADWMERMATERKEAVRKRKEKITLTATYRLQFNKDFTFYDAASIVPYLAELGISHVYASPYFKARSGSTHGYDVVDYQAFNPEIGGEEGYLAFLSALKEHGLSHIVDIVPNHMGIGPENAWWMHMLEWGMESPYAQYFDIAWEEKTGKIVLPCLAGPYGEVLDNGELRLVYEQETGRFFVEYGSLRFPLCPHHYPDQAALDVLNHTPEALHALLEKQYYRLSYWRVASEEINYRRFFENTELAGLCTEKREVFNHVHRLIFSYIRRGEVAGLRIDHSDGLRDPAEYCARVREHVGKECVIYLEKILAAEEHLRPWHVDGTSGYEALNQINAVFVESSNKQKMEEIYAAFTAEEHVLLEVIYRAKHFMLTTSFASELNGLSKLLKEIAEEDYHTRDYPLARLKEALAEVISWFPIYRTYITDTSCTQEDKDAVSFACLRASVTSKENGVYRFIEETLLSAHTGFALRFQQLTSKVMAKGLEDTAFYRYHSLLSLNEVGGDPDAFFCFSVEEFHRENQERLAHFPRNLITTQTHDTKRGEDARARINILSDAPELWRENVFRWQEIHREFRTPYKDNFAPSRSDEYFLYQTLIGTCPVVHEESYRERLRAYMLKAMREAKCHTDWFYQDTHYEDAMLQFIDRILAPPHFEKEVLPFIKMIAYQGLINSLAQVVLKLTVPGIPDIYQGSERWDFSMVDPDNRRPVDYGVLLDALLSHETLQELLTHYEDGYVKQRLIQRLLHLRLNLPELFTEGSYFPLTAKGSAESYILAFTRSYHDHTLLVAVPLHLAAMKEDFGDTVLVLEEEMEFRNVLTEEHIEAGTELSVAALFKAFPVAVLVSE